MPIENSNFYASIFGVYPCTKNLKHMILVVNCIIKNVQVVLEDEKIKKQSFTWFEHICIISQIALIQIIELLQVQRTSRRSKQERLKTNQSTKES